MKCYKRLIYEQFSKFQVFVAHSFRVICRNVSRNFVDCCYQWGLGKTLEPIITQILGALTTDQWKVSDGAKLFTDFSVTSGEFASTCKEKQWNKHSVWFDKKYEWEIVTWVQIIESWSDWESATASHLISLALMFVVLEALQWIQFTFPRQKERQKIDKKTVYDSK